MLWDGDQRRITLNRYVCAFAAMQHSRPRLNQAHLCVLIFASERQREPRRSVYADKES
jgi:hypothetical protein